MTDQASYIKHLEKEIDQCFQDDKEEMLVLEKHLCVDVECFSYYLNEVEDKTY